METTEEITKEIFELRKKLHRSIIRTMKELNICANDNNIEIFKRWYLLDYHNVETSRALNKTQLDDAIKNLQLISKSAALNSLLLRYKNFESDRDILRASDGQVRNITAIAKYRLGLDNEAIRKYIEKSLHRKVHLWEITIEEAHLVIKRLEEWEAKELTRGRK